MKEENSKGNLFEEYVKKMRTMLSNDLPKDFLESKDFEEVCGKVFDVSEKEVATIKLMSQIKMSINKTERK